MTAHVELEEDVVVGVLVGEGDGALFLQMDGINQRHCTFIPVRLQIHSLWRPRRAAAQMKQALVVFVYLKWDTTPHNKSTYFDFGVELPFTRRNGCVFVTCCRLGRPLHLLQDLRSWTGW